MGLLYRAIRQTKVRGARVDWGKDSSSGWYSGDSFMLLGAERADDILGLLGSKYRYTV